MISRKYFILKYPFVELVMKFIKKKKGLFNKKIKKHRFKKERKISKNKLQIHRQKFLFLSPRIFF